MVKKCVPISGMFLMAVVIQAAISQRVGPCEDSREYVPPHPGAIVVPPLMVRQIFGRAVIEAGETVITDERVTPACLSLFKEESHHFVASVPVNKRGGFKFPRVAPGKYRLVARSPGLCTGNTSVEVTTSGADRGRKGIVVHFRIRNIDDCTYADYDSKSDPGNN